MLLTLLITALFLWLSVFLLTPYRWKSNKFYQSVEKLPGPKYIPFFGTALDFQLNREDLLPKFIEYAETYGSFFKLWLLGHLSVFLIDPDDIEIILSNSQHISKSYVYSLLHPWLGTGLLTSTDILPKLIKTSETYGSIFKIWLLGHLTIFLTDPDDIEVILNNSQHISKSYVYTFLHPWLGAGLLTSKGSKWQTRRKLLTPTFHFKILEDYVEVFNSNSAILVQRLAEEPDTVVDINAYMTLCTLDIICETAMGTSVHAQQGGGQDYIQAVKRIGELFQYRHLTFWLHSDLIFPLTPSGREQKRVLKVLHGFTEGMIKTRRAEYRRSKEDNNADEKKSRKRLTFLDLLIEISETEGQLSDLDIREEVDTFMFEGHDTTAAALCWAVFLLGHNPLIQEKVFEEMQEIFGADDREPTMSDLLQMTYLDRVVKETLRLYPSVPAISRTLDSPVQIRGFTLLPETMTPIIPFILHRNPKLYPDPETFNPDHFLPEKVQGRHPFAYLPFSAGPRNCIGQRFARLEEKAVLSALVRKFSFTSLDRREDVKLLMDLILRPMKGLRIKFTPRI